MDEHTQSVSTETHQKLAIAFIIGLLIGAGAVWVYFANTNKAEAPTTEEKIEEGEEEKNEDEQTTETPVTEVSREVNITPAAQTLVGNDYDIQVNNQPSGNFVAIANVSMPQGGGWVVVHEQEDGVMGNALGAQYFEEGSWSGSVSLLRNTVVGKDYFVMLYNDNGDRRFSLENDKPFIDRTTGQAIRKSFRATTR